MIILKIQKGVLHLSKRWGILFWIGRSIRIRYCIICIHEYILDVPLFTVYVALPCHAESAEPQHRMLCQQLIKEIQQRVLCIFLPLTKLGESIICINNSSYNWWQLSLEVPRFEPRTARATENAYLQHFKQKVNFELCTTKLKVKKKPI